MKWRSYIKSTKTKLLIYYILYWPTLEEHVNLNQRKKRKVHLSESSWTSLNHLILEQKSNMSGKHIQELGPGKFANHQNIFRHLYKWRGECKTMLSDDLGEKKHFRERAWIFACGLQCNRKTWFCIFVAGFCFVYKDAARKTEWFFCIRNILKMKRSLAEKLRDIVKHT